MLALALALPLAMQSELRAELPVTHPNPVVASPTEYWIGTVHGHLYASRDAGDTWREVEVPLPPSFYGPPGSMESVLFFDSKVGILAAEDHTSEGEVLRTQDGGQTWETVPLPGEMSISDACTLAGGRAWLVESTGEIEFTEDSGATWRSFPSPLGKSIRPQSLHFDTPKRGVLGADKGRLYLTTDERIDWKRLEAPAAQHATAVTDLEALGAPPNPSATDPLGWVEPAPDADAKVEKVRLFGERLVVYQGESAYVRLLDGDDPWPWSELRFGGQTVIEFELHPRGLAVVTTSGVAGVLDKNLEPAWSSTRAIEGAPFARHQVALSVVGEKLLVTDNRAYLHEVDEQGVRSWPLLLAEDASTWAIEELDRGADDTFWGIGRWYLYKSRTGARTWTRVAPLPMYVHQVLVQTSGDVLLIGIDEVRRWLVKEGEFEPVPAFERFVFPNIERRGEFWLAYGARYVSEEARRSGKPGMHEPFVGDYATGVVLASTDGGQSWQSLVEWEGGRIEALFFTPGNRLIIHRAGAGIRSGVLHWEPGGEVRADLEPAAAPKIEIRLGSYLTFFDEERGVLRADTHETRHTKGPRTYVTTDGGRTWTDDTDGDTAELPALYRLGDGPLIGWYGYRNFHTGQDDPPDELARLGESGFEEFRAFESAFRWLQVDVAGRLILELQNGEIWSLSADASTWTRVRGAE